MSLRRAIRLVAVVAVAGALCSSCGTTRPPGGAAISYRAQDSATGRSVSLRDLRGHPVLLSSWATWCAPCRTELPALQRLYEARRGDGLRVVIVNIDDAGKDEAAIAEVVDELGLTMPRWRDRQGAFTTTFRGFAVPMSVLINRDGRAVDTWHGPLDTGSAEVQRSIDRVLS